MKLGNRKMPIVFQQDRKRNKQRNWSSKVLLVEGPDDCHVIASLSQAHSIPDIFDICDCGGSPEVIKQLNALIAQSDPPKIIGIVIDADDPSLEQKWTSIRDKLRNNHGYQLPIKPAIEGTLVKGSGDLPDLGFWLMPNNQVTGKLESFCIELADPASLEFSKHCVAAAQGQNLTTFKPVDLEKAIIHTYLAWQDEPGYPLGKAITAQSLRPETPIAREFTNWLTRLFVTDS